MTERRCRGCRGFYDKKLDECPTCATPAYAVNVALGSQRFRDVLNERKRHAIEET